jgi:hypothetical protein
MGVDKVAADNFYKDDGDKVKQNWYSDYWNIPPFSTPIPGMPQYSHHSRQ